MKPHKLLFSSNIYNKNTNCYNLRKKIILKLKNKLHKYDINEKISVIVHGSYAEGGITNFSDIDVIVFVLDNLSYTENIILKKIIKDINSFSLLIDRSMHHLCSIIYIKEIQNYDESFIPLKTLMKSVHIYGRINFTIFVNDELSINNAKHRLLRQINGLKNYDKHLFKYSNYKFKTFVSVFFLILTINYQIKNSSFDTKKNIMDFYHKDSNNKIFELFKRISSVRSDWKNNKYFESLRCLIIKIIGPNILMQKIFNLKKNYNKKEINNIIKDVNKYLDEIKL